MPEEKRGGLRGLLPVAVLVLLALVYPQLGRLSAGPPVLGGLLTIPSINYGNFMLELAWMLLAVSLVSILVNESGRTIELKREQILFLALGIIAFAVFILPKAAFLIFTATALALELTLAGYIRPRDILPWTVRASSVILTLAMLYLTYQFIVSDFSNAYVWKFSSRTLPLYYRISAVWAGQEGTFLLWAWMVMVSSWFVAERHGWEDSFVRKAQLVTLLVALFFTHLSFLVSPFDQIYEQNPDLTPAFVENDLPGQGLNPLLRDPWMAVHPPLVFLGYAGVTIPLAAALVFLFTRDERWETFARPWNRFAWLFLTLGIAVGGFWSYKVLGWGGYWAWDPVETSSFIPWLTISGLMHASVMYRRKRTFDYLGPFLAVVSFLLVIYATFITRSGLWESVHAFAETTAGPWLAAAILNIAAVYLILVADYATRGGEKGASRRAKEAILAFLAAEFLMLVYLHLRGEGTVLLPVKMYLPTLVLAAIMAVLFRVSRLRKARGKEVEGTGDSAEEGVGEGQGEDPDDGREVHLITYDNLFYLTVILFFVLSFVSFWGITYPMFEQARTGAKISVGIEFFNRWSFPFTMALFAVLALCFVFGRVRKNRLLGGLGATAVVSLASMVVSPSSILYTRLFNAEAPAKWYWPYMDATIPLIILALLMVGIKVRDGIERKNSRTLGIAAIHLGVVLCLAGSMFSAAYSQEFHQNFLYPQGLDVPKHIGRGYSIALGSLDMEKTADGWWATHTVVEVFKNGKPQSVGVAESIDDKKFGRVTHVYIQRGLLNDVYVIFQGANQIPGGIVVPLAVKVVPGVSILWLGIVLMSIGILPLLCDTRRGFKVDREEVPPDVAEKEEEPERTKKARLAEKRRFLEKSLKDLEDNFKKGLIDEATYRNLKEQYEKSLAELEGKL